MPKPQIGQPMRRVVLTRRSKWQQATPGARNRNKRCVENGDAQNQDGHEPTDGEMGALRPDLQPECSHQKTEKHCSTVAHENFSGVEILSKKPQSGPKGCGAQS